MVRVLLIDDDETVREVLYRTLKRLEHQVEIAEDGLQGLDAFRQRAPDVVITDILMPRMDGVELIRRIHAIEPGARVVAISGGGPGLEREDSLELAAYSGAQAVIQKPFTRKRLQQAIDQALASEVDWA